jgi:hypothetical protein
MKQIIPFVRERIVSRQIMNLNIRPKNKSDEVFEKTIDLKDIDEKEYPSYLADKMVAFEDMIILPYIFREGSQYQCGESGLIELIHDKEISYNLVVSNDYKDNLDIDKIRDILTMNGGNLYLTPHLSKKMILIPVLSSLMIVVECILFQDWQIRYYPEKKTCSISIGFEIPHIRRSDIIYSIGLILNPE